MISPANTWKWWGYPNFSLLGILPTNTCFSDVKQIPKPGHLPSPEAPSWLRGQTSAAWRPWLSPRKRQRWCHPWRLPRQSATKTMEIGGFLGHDVKMLVLHVFFHVFFRIYLSWLEATWIYSRSWNYDISLHQQIYCFYPVNYSFFW